MAVLSDNEKNFDGGAQQGMLSESALLLSLYRILIESNDLSSGLRSALEIVCQFTDWVVGTAWLPSEDQTQLRLCASWHRDEPKLTEFIGTCQQQSYLRDVGIPGRVWQRAKEEWTRNLAAGPVELFPMAPAAHHAGLKAAFGVPITHDNQVAGVLMFHMREVKEEDERLVQVVSGVATQLGFALHHKQSEEVLRKQQALARRGHEDLERQAEERTAELRQTNEMLQVEIAQREKLQEGLQDRLSQQAAVADIGEHASGGAELSVLMAEATVLVAQTLKVEFCTILKILPDGEGLLITAGFGWKEELLGHAKVGTGTSSQAGYTLLTGQPVVVDDLSTEKRFEAPALLRESGVVSGVAVTIGTKDRPFGVLGAHTVRRRAFSIDDIHLMQAMANVLFQAVEHSRALEEVRRNANWLERLIAATQDAVLSIDRSGRVVLFNAAAEQIFGYVRNEVIGQKVNMLMAEPYRSEHDGYIARYEQTAEAHVIGRIRTVTARRKSGELFPIELSVTEIREDKDVRYAAFIRDISEKNRLHAMLVESERLAAIGSTAAKIGHEIANPVNGMSLTIQLLEQRLSRIPDNLGVPALATVRRLKDETSRLQKLVRQFATISRREKYDLRPTALPNLISEVIAMQAPYLAHNGIQVENAIASDLPLVSVDRDKIKQALLNLVKNAGEAMPGGGKITIVAFAIDDAVVMEISDTGAGIPLDIDAFEPFVTTKKEGTGVGLVIVRQILTAHAGKISYRSKPGEGTTFRVELPVR
jgi:two-component system, LuxR family, sensor kinase FixL